MIVAGYLASLAPALKRGGLKRRPAAALTSTEVKGLLDHCGTDVAGLRGRALFLLGFAGALRRSVLVALDREHLRFTEHGQPA